MFILQFQYKPLFKINLENNYFQDGRLRNYSILPAQETSVLLNSLGLIMRNSETGFDILADNCKSDQLRLSLEALKENAQKLKFLLFISDPYFKNYTDIPFDTNQKLLYFSNQHLGNSLSGSLHELDYVAQNNLFNIVDNKFLENKENVRVPNYKNGQALGLIELELSDSIINQITDNLMDAELISYNYSIRFDSRSVVWKYVVVPAYSKKLKGLKITGQKDKDGVKFSNPQEIMIKDDKSALVFTSEKPLKFQQFYPYSFQLKRGDNDSGGKTLIKKLQFASLEKLKPLNTKEPDGYFSEIYIYI